MIASACRGSTAITGPGSRSRGEQMLGEEMGATKKYFLSGQTLKEAAACDACASGAMHGPRDLWNLLS